MDTFDVDLARFATHARSVGAAHPLDDPAFQLAREGKLSVHWAPFDHVTVNAQLILVGITPGREHAGKAYVAFKAALSAGYPLPDALRIAKQTGSFSGPLRSNLVRLLDKVGFQRVLRANTSAVLFQEGSDQVHLTSALRYPVLLAGANYNGTPDMLRTPTLRRMVETYLASELRALPNAFVLPLGPKPTAALQHLVSRGVIAKGRVLEGLPHPSGANAERISYFLDLKPRSALSSKTRPEMIERARDGLITQITRLATA